MKERIPRIIKDKVNLFHTDRKIYSVAERENYGNLSVLKFGGAALADANAIEISAQTVSRHHKNGERVTVVVSAMRGVTDNLIEAVGFQQSGDTKNAARILQSIFAKHMDALSALSLSQDARTDAAHGIYNIFLDIHKNLFPQGMSERRSAQVKAAGEKLSEQLIAARCRELGLPIVAFDSSDFIITNMQYDNAIPDLRKTEERATGTLGPLLKRDKIPIVTGYFAANDLGDITILGRDCSDLSAALLARVLRAKSVYLYKDVDGIFPNRPQPGVVEEPIRELSVERYYEIDGAQKAVHPSVIELLAGTKTDIWVRNVFKPTALGTQIIHSSQREAEGL